MFLDLPNHLDPTSQEPSADSLGFVKSEDARPYSPALQRQVSLLNADKGAEYFLFNELDQPVRVVLDSQWDKAVFRLFRSQAWAKSSPEKGPVEAMAQHLLRIMRGKPGLSREMILRQFDREYGEGYMAKVEAYEKERAEAGDDTDLMILSKTMMLAGTKLERSPFASAKIFKR